MTLKRTDLARRLAQKIEGQMKGQAAPQRFGTAATEVPDRRERRRQEAAAGLVPFACKLPSELAATLRERAASHPGALNGLVAELLAQGLAAPAAGKTARRAAAKPKSPAGGASKD